MTARKESKEAARAAEPSFEETLTRLEAIVDELEGGQLSLEDSLARYEEGVRLSRHLTAALEAAEKRIERLVAEGDSPPRTEPLELDLGEGGKGGGPEGLPI